LTSVELPKVSSKIDNYIFYQHGHCLDVVCLLLRVLPQIRPSHFMEFPLLRQICQAKGWV
jgi:hypothetical protein